MRVVSVPIRTNADLRPSRLLKSIAMYIRASAITMVRSFVAYRPFHFFGITGVLSLLAGLALGGRFLWFYWSGSGSGHVQSLILTAVLLITGFLLIVVALLADLVSVNRKLLEKVDLRVAGLEERLPPKPEA
jgi:hypothetical protein